MEPLDQSMSDLHVWGTRARIGGSIALCLVAVGLAITGLWPAWILAVTSLLGLVNPMILLRRNRVTPTTKRSEFE